MIIDNDVLNGVEPEVPYEDEVFPKSKFNPDFLEKAYIPIKDKITKFHPAYCQPHHRLYVYTNVEDLNLYYLRDGIPLPVEKDHFFESVCKGCKGIFIIRYYTFDKNKINDASILFNLLTYYIRLEDLNEKLYPKIKEYLEKAIVESPGEISIRIVDFIDIEKFSESNILEISYLNMVFAKYIDDLINYTRHLRSNIRDKILEIDTTDKVVITLEFHSNKVFDKRYVKILDEVVELNSNKLTTTQKPELWISIIENGIINKSKAIGQDDEIFCKIHTSKEALLAEENIFKKIVEETKISLQIVKEKLNQLREIRKQLLEHKIEFLKILKAIEKNYDLQRDKETKELMDLLKLVKSLF